MTGKQILIDAEDALALVAKVLPLLEAASPQIAAADTVIRLGVSGAQLLAPVIGRLVDNLSNAGVISIETQTVQLAKVQQALDFSGAEWVPSSVSTPKLAGGGTDSAGP